MPPESSVLISESSDDVDNNTYHYSFSGYLIAGGASQPAIDLTTWRSITNGKGNEYDTNSTFDSNHIPTGYEFSKTTIHQQNVSHLEVFIILVQGLFSVFTVASGGVYNVTDPYGTAVVTSLKTLL